MSFNKKSLPPITDLKQLLEKDPTYLDLLMKADMVMGSSDSMKLYEEHVALRQMAIHDTNVTEMTSQRDSD
jgi:hypothetical protein